MANENSGNCGHRARLRQRMFEGGEGALLDRELVEYLLALAVPRRDTKPLAKRPIAQFGGIGPRLSADAETLRRERLNQGVIGALKIAEATALRLLETRMGGRPLLSSWEPLGDYFQAAMDHAAIEKVRIPLLKAKKMLIANESLWTGSVDEASVHVREVIARAIALGATALIIVHNHSSGYPAPSRQDIVLTKELIDAGRHMKIAVHDHVIFGAQGLSSMRAMGLI